ncbi:hypothetical protein MRB53_007007 [Persea americana]|uniref:Uncharacterized protein n=1 Tax=Persea americana TaxID=3435 RepID=A0ACC2MI09_PERAE|nr:hypothetical protein MRB53_007007 [Persea americana]|eukprot:TRINITY_DN1923_c0_g1_i1.p1 TRINITY_DN1923_c0_g1~~TRINITY_DN1923_c0_g1_i1.p1  ORF type:complete len:413 (-),score=116.77 TRINITY_DN1923_c0_g1_i1:207-1445(-)
MDDTEDDARYPPNPHPNYHHSFSASSSHRPKLPVRNPSSAPPHLAANFFHQDQEDDAAAEEEEEDPDDSDEDDEEEDGDDQGNATKQVAHVGDEEEEEEEDDDDDDDDEGEAYPRPDTDDESENRGRKRRRMEKLAHGYEFAPRNRPPQAPAPAPKTPAFGGSRNSPPEWSEQATFALLDAWGERFLQLGRKSLRTDEWLEVAKTVSQASKAVRTDSQCRNRLDTLKKKYKKEKTSGSTSKWVFFKKMEMLMSTPPPPRQPGLACGLDSGEYVFMNPRAYVNHYNGLDEMRDSPGNSESEGDDGGGDEDDEESEGLPPSRMRIGERAEEENGGASSSYRLLADSIHKFGEIYEKIEVSKRQQMMELEKMRIDFHRELELQKRQILERAQAEIAKIRQGDDEEIDVSVENTSG